MVIIVDNYIVKKFFIDDTTNSLMEAQTIVEWGALMSYPQFTSEIPSFYYFDGVVLTKD